MNNVIGCLVLLAILLGVLAYIGLFTGHTQQVFSEANENDAMIELIADGMRAVPADWHWRYGKASHSELQINGRDIELTGRQSAMLWDASAALRTGGGVKNNEALTKALAERIVKRYPVT